MVLKSIGVLSCGKIVGVIYGAMGLVGGVLFGLFMLLGALFDPQQAGQGGAVAMMAIAVAGIFLAPLFYGVIGFIAGIITAALYNVVATYIGGLELDIEPRTPTYPTP